VNAQQAEADNLHALTTAFHLPDEQALLDATTAPLIRGRIRFALVEVAPGQVEVWREKMILSRSRSQTNSLSRISR
jgi:hypothetical protein